MVMQLLRSEIDLVVDSGFVCVPLLFDPHIAEEIDGTNEQEGLTDRQAPERSRTVMVSRGRHFIRSVTIESVLANVERIDRDHYQSLKEDCLGRFPQIPDLKGISGESKLRTILLKVMPHFIRKSRGFQRRHLDDDALLDLICSKIDIPRIFIERAEQVTDPGPLLQRLNELNRLERAVEPFEEGPATGAMLGRWVDKALQVQIVNGEIARLEQELNERKRFGVSKKNHIALLLYLTENGSLEVDGFGFSRIGSRDDYLIYRRTGEYILKDYYARSYRFPDCRVAVPTTRPFRPLVLETYKHPFLLGYAPRQEICLTEYNWPDEFTADNIVRLLEDGINALLYGYDARRRNGYHSLDPTLHYVKTIEFTDYRV